MIDETIETVEVVAEAPKRGRPKTRKVNSHDVGVHLGDGRVVYPGQAIPDDVDGDLLEALDATGFFK
jgi:hypothetical protein